MGGVTDNAAIPSKLNVSWVVVTVVGIVVLHSVGLFRTDLWDPWETHYGEVARQISMRSDPLDLWWQAGQAGPQGQLETSFASKPPLAFWALAMGLELFGVGTTADPTEMVNAIWPRIALRLPPMIAGWLTLAVIAWLVCRWASARAGLMAAWVLATCPQWVMISRQALTDIFFIAPLSLGAVAWAYAWLQPDRMLRVRKGRYVTLPWDRAYAIFVGLFVVGALVPLIVLHEHSIDPYTWRSLDPQGWEARGLSRIARQLWIYWGLSVVGGLLSCRWRSRSQACMGVVYVSAGLSLMAKGLIGPGILGALILCHLWVSGRWMMLWRAQLPLGLLWFAVTCMPWHHAMMLYRGDPWFFEWVIQNNLQRFSTGEQVHAIGNAGFYIQTLGLAAFPWVAVVPSVLVRIGRRMINTKAEPRDEPSLRTQAERYCYLWLVVSLVLISYSTTKYYHYLAPCLPPLAMLVGFQLERWWDARDGSLGWMEAVLGGVIVVGVVRDACLSPAWLVHLTTYLYTEMWAIGAPVPWGLLATGGVMMFGVVALAIGRSRGGIVTWIVSGALTSAYLLGSYVPAVSGVWSQHDAVATYFRERQQGERLVSWWFYYRGETFYTKQDVWVMRDPNRAQLAALVDETRGRADALWFITIESHADQLARQLPTTERHQIDVRYRNGHYVLMRVGIAPLPMFGR